MPSAWPMSSFLRPFATTSPAPTRQLLRFSQSAQCALKPSNISRSSAQEESPVAAAASSSDAVASSSQAQVPKLPYHVLRTPSRKLPVYKLAKAGGNLQQTKLRKIVGDTRALRDDLKAFLRVADKDIAINSVTGHIVVKGWYKPQIERFLEERKF